MVNTQGEGSKYAQIRQIHTLEQIHTKYTAEYTVTRVVRYRYLQDGRCKKLRLDFHLQKTVQSAGWSADVERWESDEDSYHSDDENEGDDREVALSEAAILQLMA